MPPQEAGKLSLGPAQTANPTHGITWAQCVNVNLSFHDPAVASLESKPLHVTSNNTIQISVVQILSEILEKSQSRRTIFPVFPPSWETTCSSWPLWPCHGQYKHKHARTLIASEFHVKTTSSLQFNGDSIWVSSRLIFRKWGSSAKFCSKGTGSSSMLSIPKAEASSKCSSLGNMSRWFVQQRAATILCWPVRGWMCKNQKGLSTMPSTNRVGRDGGLKQWTLWWAIPVVWRKRVLNVFNTGSLFSPQNVCDGLGWWSLRARHSPGFMFVRIFGPRCSWRISKVIHSCILLHHLLDDFKVFVCIAFTPLCFASW